MCVCVCVSFDFTFASEFPCHRHRPPKLREKKKKKASVYGCCFESTYWQPLHNFGTRDRPEFCNVKEGGGGRREGGVV